jgi:hypothetical protein
MKKLFILILLSVVSCGHVNFDPPKGFVEIKKRTHKIKFVSSDAAVMKVTHKENRKNGTSTFWSQLLLRELTEFKGYKLVSKNKYRGSSGIIMEFTAPYKNESFHYTIGVLANKDDLYIIELGSENKIYKKHKKAFMSLISKVYKKEIK